MSSVDPVRKRVAVLISGRGSNMSALIEAARAAEFPASISLVLSNRTDASGLEIASEAGIAAISIDHRLYASRQEFEQALHERLIEHGIELVCLAGFLRVLTPWFIDRWQGRLLNIHPSLLPAFPGLRTHERALAEGVRSHGCTVHFVTPALDAGPTIAQATVEILANDTASTLGARVLEQEHRLYPRALRSVAEGRARLEGDRVAFD